MKIKLFIIISLYLLFTNLTFSQNKLSYEEQVYLILTHRHDKPKTKINKIKKLMKKTNTGLDRFLSTFINGMEGNYTADYLKNRQIFIKILVPLLRQDPHKKRNLSIFANTIFKSYAPALLPGKKNIFNVLWKTYPKEAKDITIKWISRTQDISSDLYSNNQGLLVAAMKRLKKNDLKIFLKILKDKKVKTSRKVIIMKALSNASLENPNIATDIFKAIFTKETNPKLKLMAIANLSGYGAGDDISLPTKNLPLILNYIAKKDYSILNYFTAYGDSTWWNNLSKEKRNQLIDGFFEKDFLTKEQSCPPPIFDRKYTISKLEKLTQHKKKNIQQKAIETLLNLRCSGPSYDESSQKFEDLVQVYFRTKTSPSQESACKIMCKIAENYSKWMPKKLSKMRGNQKYTFYVLGAYFLLKSFKYCPTSPNQNKQKKIVQDLLSYLIYGDKSKKLSCKKSQAKGVKNVVQQFNQIQYAASYLIPFAKVFTMFFLNEALKEFPTHKKAILRLLKDKRERFIKEIKFGANFMASSVRHMAVQTSYMVDSVSYSNSNLEGVQRILKDWNFIDLERPKNKGVNYGAWPDKSDKLRYVSLGKSSARNVPFYLTLHTNRKNYPSLKLRNDYTDQLMAMLDNFIKHSPGLRSKTAGEISHSGPHQTHYGYYYPGIVKAADASLLILKETQSQLKYINLLPSRLKAKLLHRLKKIIEIRKKLLRYQDPNNRGMRGLLANFNSKTGLFMGDWNDYMKAWTSPLAALGIIPLLSPKNCNGKKPEFSSIYPHQKEIFSIKKQSKNTKQATMDFDEKYRQLFRQLKKENAIMYKSIVDGITDEIGYGAAKHVRKRNARLILLIDKNDISPEAIDAAKKILQKK